MNAILWTILVSAAPFIELRGGIPIGIEMGLNPLLVFTLALVSNILVLFPIYVFMAFVFEKIEHWGAVGKALKRVHKKSHKWVEKYGTAGLLLFVAIPLPGSGAYSGVLAAHIFKIERKKAVPAIIGGVLIAGVLVLAGWYGVITKVIHLVL